MIKRYSIQKTHVEEINIQQSELSRERQGQHIWKYVLIVFWLYNLYDDVHLFSHGVNGKDQRVSTKTV